MTDPSPFHVGEQQVQERLGVRDIETWARKVVRPYPPTEVLGPRNPVEVTIRTAQAGSSASTVLVAASRGPNQDSWGGGTLGGLGREMPCLPSRPERVTPQHRVVSTLSETA